MQLFVRPSLIQRSFLVICLSSLALSAQKRFGSTDPAGNPQNLTLFRDQQVFVMSTGTKATPWQTNVVGFDGKLNPTSNVSQLPWSGNIPFTQQAIQAVAGRLLTPEKDDIALVQRSESNPTDLVLRFRDGSLSTTLSSNFMGREDSWSDFFAASAGDLDRLYDAQGNYHDEIAVAWIELENGGDCFWAYESPHVAVPHVAVVNYNDPTHPAVFSQRLERTDGQYASTCTLRSYDFYAGDNSSLPKTAIQPNDNLVATAIGDFDGDGFNELAVAYLRGQAGTVISIVIYRYQNGGTQASLTPVNTFEIYNPNVSMVGTLSLAAGDFDGSGVDQLMVGSAYWSGTPDGYGQYQKGTLTTQPVVFLVKGGQGSGTVSNAVSAGAGTATTNVTVSLSQGAYVPQTVTISAATGSWAAINGTWQVTPTATGFSLPIDSSQFGQFDGQTVKVNAGAPLTQAATSTLDTFSPGGGAMAIDNADRDGRIRVQLAPGLFRFDPNKGYGYRRRQIAMAWNASKGIAADTHLVILQVTNDDQLTVALRQDNLFFSHGDTNRWPFKTYQTLAMAAGAFRGDNAHNDPTWSLFFSGVGNGNNTDQVGTAPAGVVNAVLRRMQQSRTL